MSSKPYKQSFLIQSDDYQHAVFFSSDPFSNLTHIKFMSLSQQNNETTYNGSVCKNLEYSDILTLSISEDKKPKILTSAFKFIETGIIDFNGVMIIQG